MINNRINKLVSKFKKHDIDGYIIPKNDEFFSEYATNDRLKTISNFSGSAGYSIILKQKNYLFVDELPDKYLEKNSFFDESKEEMEEFEFNQDIENESGINSPGWLRYQKRIK